MNFKHLENLRVQALFSACGQYRYRLLIEDVQRPEGEMVCVIMQNPSEADEFRADKSIQFLEKVIFEKHSRYFQRIRKMVIVNQFALIQKKGFIGKPENIGPDNDRILQDSINDADVVVIAWGKQNRYEQRKEFVYSLLRSSSPKRLLSTKKHPSRGFYKDFFIPFTEISLT